MTIHIENDRNRITIDNAKSANAKSERKEKVHTTPWPLNHYRGIAKQLKQNSIKLF